MVTEPLRGLGHFRGGALTRNFRSYTSGKLVNDTVNLNQSLGVLQQYIPHSANSLSTEQELGMSD